MGEQSGGLAQGPCLGLGGGGLQHSLRSEPVGPLGHTRFWQSLLRVQNRGAGSVLTHPNTHLVGRVEARGECCTQGKHWVLGVPGWALRIKGASRRLPGCSKCSGKDWSG